LPRAQTIATQTVNVWTAVCARVSDTTPALTVQFDNVLLGKHAFVVKPDLRSFVFHRLHCCGAGFRGKQKHRPNLLKPVLPTTLLAFTRTRNAPTAVCATPKPGGACVSPDTKALIVGEPVVPKTAVGTENVCWTLK